ncbi:hypothetical protein [Nocardia sp. XZ_19_385]|uniref:DUF7373 family lipoprotein n=1 Tax=Nocardia sp. XZ_19_385 TaxID=2769488 RepID=UPI002816055F|nr:hypothetical protein [Nocardia sp. XZ_19_385]
MEFAGRMRAGARARILALLAIVVAAGVGCSSVTVGGHPRPMLTPVELTTLKTGPHPREPTQYDPKISGVADIREIEARRMLNYLVLPPEIDSEISEIGAVELFSSPADPFIQEVLPEKYRPATVDNNLLAGVYESRINSSLRNRKKLIISVLRFPTPAASQKAADDFDRIANEDAGRHRLPIEGYPDARASSADDVTGLSFIARDQFVILTNAGVPQPDQTTLSGVIKKTVETQIARLQQLHPMAFDDVLDLPTDPDSILRRALPAAADYSDPFILTYDFGAFQPAADLHYERNPLELKKAFEASGVDLIGRRGGIVYRARDLTGAFHLQSALVKTGKNDEELPSPPGLPDTRCIRLDEVDVVRKFDEMCAVIYDRYVAVVVTKSKLSGAMNPDLYQRAAAQYSVLVKSE